jgi:hypothetical protein
MNLNNAIIIATTLLTLGTIAVLSSMATTTHAAATTTNNTSTTSTPPTPSSGIELSPQTVYQEQVRDQGEIPINQTHIQLSFSGNGTLNLPNGIETIRTTSTGSGIASMIGTFAGKEILTTEDGSENATVTFYEIVRFGEQEGRGIAIAAVHTNSTGILAPLDGMILIGVDELPSEGNSMVTLWEWQSGIPLPSTTTMEESPPQMNTTTTTGTNATTIITADTNATAAEEEGEQQTTPTIPTPLLE